LEKNQVKHFVKSLLGQVEKSEVFTYDYVLFDCPAYFTSLAYSVLSSSSLVLIPVNPDAFAFRGVEIMIEGFLSRIKPASSPKFAVFMNKARLYRDELNRETVRWWSDIKYICEEKRKEGVFIRAFESFIPEREDIRRSIVGRYFPDEFEDNFARLWSDINKCLE
jgi:chromosome partitioning protein